MALFSRFECSIVRVCSVLALGTVLLKTRSPKACWDEGRALATSCSVGSRCWLYERFLISRGMAGIISEKKAKLVTTLVVTGRIQEELDSHLDRVEALLGGRV